MGSWVRTITSPFRKARTIFSSPTGDHNKSKTRDEHQNEMSLQCEVMACSYEDVRVMWSMLDKLRAGEQNTGS